jgi:hypothetical protein
MNTQHTRVFFSSLPHLALGRIWLKGIKSSLPLFRHSSTTFHHCLPHDNMFQCSYGTTRKNQNFSPSSLTHLGRPLLLLWLWVLFQSSLYNFILLGNLCNSHPLNSNHFCIPPIFLLKNPNFSTSNYYIILN